MEMHQTQPKKSVGFHLQWQPFFRVCFLMMWWRFTADRISHQLPLPCPEPLSPEWLLRFSLWRSLAIPATARPGVYSFTPLTIPDERGLWSRGGWSELLSQRKELTWELSSTCSALEQEPNHRLLFAVEACGRLHIFEVRFCEWPLTLILKWYNTAQHRGRLFTPRPW